MEDKPSGIRKTAKSFKEGTSHLVKGELKEALENYSAPFERSIGLIGVIIISLSAMLGSGLFVLPALAADSMSNHGTSGFGGGVWLSFLLAATLILPSALSKSEMATAMPTSGGSYVYIEKTYGPIYGTIAGVGLWSSFMLKSAFALIGFSAYIYATQGMLGFELTENGSKWLGIGLLALMTWINIVGVKKIKVIQGPIMFGAVFFILALIVYSFVTGQVEFDRVIGSQAFAEEGLFSANGVRNLAVSTAFVFVSYSGVTKIAAVAEEIKDPARNIPLGILATLIISGTLYAITAFALFGTLAPETLGLDGAKPSKAPIYEFAYHLGGSNGATLGLIASGLAVLALSAGALAGVMASSRFPFAMARDNLVPKPLEKVSPKYKTPHNAILVTSAAMAASIIFLPVSDIAKIASGFKILIFMVINTCVLILRYSKVDWYQPVYKSPLFPVVQIIGVISGIVLFIVMGPKAYIGAGAGVIIGFIAYLSYGRTHSESRDTPYRILRRMLGNKPEIDQQE